MIEYIVMKQYGDGEPEEASGPFASFYDADSARDDVAYPNDDGYMVRTIAEAERAMAAIKRNAETHYYVAAREVRIIGPVYGPVE